MSLRKERKSLSFVVMVIRYGFHEMRLQWYISKRWPGSLAFFVLMKLKLSLEFWGFKPILLAFHTNKQMECIPQNEKWNKKFFYSYFIHCQAVFLYVASFLWKLRTCYDFFAIWICRSLQKAMIGPSKQESTNGWVLFTYAWSWLVVRLLVRNVNKLFAKQIFFRVWKKFEAKCIVRAKEIMKTVVSWYCFWDNCHYLTVY